jgi:hypothetical protein
MTWYGTMLVAHYDLHTRTHTYTLHAHADTDMHWLACVHAPPTDTQSNWE